MPANLMGLLNLLLALRGYGSGAGQQRQRQQRPPGTGGAQGAGPGSFEQNPENPISNYPWSPQTQMLLNQLNTDFWNKGGGQLGNDIVGGGGVFSGLYRGPQGSYHPGMTDPNVGWIGFLSGQGPQMGQTPGQSAYNFFGPGGTRGDYGYPGQGTIADTPGLGAFFNNIGGMGSELSGGTQYYL